MKTLFVTDDRCPAARAVAAHLAALGYEVLLNVCGGQTPAGCAPVKVSLCDQEALEALMDQLSGNLAGVIWAPPPTNHATIEAATESQWRSAFEQGALSSMTLTRVACEHMARYGRGVMIYLGSIHAERPMGSGFLSTMNLTATQMLCREVAIDYGRKGLSSFYVQRGIMESDNANDNDITGQYTGINIRNPLGRAVEPDDLCGLIAFLLTDAARILNGSDIRADAGATMFYGLQREVSAP